MIITIDTRWIRSKKLDGISRVVLNLVKNILIEDRENKYQLLYNEEELKEIIKDFIPSEAKNYQFIKTDIKILSVEELFSLRKLLKRINTQIFYSPHYVTLPFDKSYKTILTVHDLIPFLFPQTLSKSSAEWKLFYKSFLPNRYLLKKADLIVAVSEATKSDIKKLFKISDNKIRVIYNGVDNSFYSSKSGNTEILDKYKIPPSFILYVGRFDPYKNILGLINSYNLLHQDIKNEYKLILGGDTRSPYYSQIKNLVKKLNLEKNIIFTGYISQKDLPLIYKAASLFIFPSLYEGFGLPVLEAMASGVPVITSDTSSLPEIAGNAALLVDPKSNREIAQAIKKVLNDDKLRKDLIYKGRKQSERFSWQKSAEKLIDIFEKIP